VERQGRDVAVGISTLFAAGLVFGTWRGLVANLWVGLAGRAWLVPLQMFVMSLPAVYLSAEWIQWHSDPARRERLLDALPWMAGAAVGVKLLAAGWFARVLVRRRTVAPAMLGRLAATWLALTAGLAVALVCLVPAILVPAYGLVLAVALLVPLARPAAAPLALAWNRHR